MRPAWATDSLYTRAYDRDAQESTANQKRSRLPHSNPTVELRLELAPEVDQLLRRLASTVGLPATTLLGRLLMDGMPPMARATEIPDEVKAIASPERRTTRVLRQVTLQRAIQHRLHGWAVATGHSPSLFAAWKILQSQDLEHTSVDTPFGAYQRLLDILHPSGRRLSA